MEDVSFQNIKILIIYFQIMKNLNRMNDFKSVISRKTTITIDRTIIMLIVIDFSVKLICLFYIYYGVDKWQKKKQK